MADLNMIRIARRAESLAGYANAAYWVEDDNANRHLEESIDDDFRALANFLGYRVERITDGVNTGKPVVAGGV